MNRRKRLVIGLFAALIALVAGILAEIPFSEDAPHPSSTQNAVDQLWASHFYDTTGKSQSMAQWRGKILVVNFWAAWCPPCREEIPALSRLQTKYAAKNVQIVGIAIDLADNVKRFTKEHPASYPLLLAENQGIELARQLGNANLALPYTLVLGPQGEHLFRRLGKITEQELDALLQNASTS